MKRGWVGLVLVAGCGRVGFEPIALGSDDAPVADAARVDAADAATDDAVTSQTAADVMAAFPCDQDVTLASDVPTAPGSLHDVVWLDRGGVQSIVAAVGVEGTTQVRAFDVSVRDGQRVVVEHPDVLGGGENFYGLAVEPRDAGFFLGASTFNTRRFEFLDGNLAFDHAGTSTVDFFAATPAFTRTVGGQLVAVGRDGAGAISYSQLDPDGTRLTNVAIAPATDMADEIRIEPVASGFVLTWDVMADFDCKYLPIDAAGVTDPGHSITVAGDAASQCRTPMMVQLPSGARAFVFQQSGGVHANVAPTTGGLLGQVDIAANGTAAMPLALIVDGTVARGLLRTNGRLVGFAIDATNSGAVTSAFGTDVDALQAQLLRVGGSLLAVWANADNTAIAARKICTIPVPG